MRQKLSDAKIICLATQGSGGSDERRLLALLSHFEVHCLRFDRGQRLRTGFTVLKQLLHARPDLVVMEGTGTPGGLALILARLIGGVRYVVSSGDAVGPFLAQRYPLLAPITGAYERLLCRLSAGFIGWTPYLVGRALTFGAPRAMTAAGFCAPSSSPLGARERIRDSLGIPRDGLVVGLVGSLVWAPRLNYCYGMELVQAAHVISRQDVYLLIVGDGSGLEHLRAAAGSLLGSKIKLTGRVDNQEVPQYLAAMDIGSLPQSTDAVGAFRYTTKISEYLAAGLPTVTGQIPLAYDLDSGWIEALPGPNPWSARFVKSLAQFIDQMTPTKLAAMKDAAAAAPSIWFDKERQISQVSTFLRDLLCENHF